METVASCFIMALALIACFNLFPSSMYALKQGESALVAEQEAQTWLETYRNEKFDTLQANLGSHNLGTSFVNGITYTSTIEIQDAPGTRSDLAKQLRVTITWRFQSKDRSLVRECWISRVRP